jgi:two-component system CheB/CheR fusion protein
MLVMSLNKAATMPGLVLGLFDVVTPAGPLEAPAAAEAVTDVDRRVAILERDLKAREEHLQTVLEEMETSNEELKSTNEELQSTNEELQSANEELETSKEELQSVNEELVTVNTELEMNVEELSQANNDMNNLMAATNIGTIFVDHHLNIQRFTPASTEIINLIQSDTGRPVSHLVSNLVNYDTLVQDTRQVLKTLIPKETEVQTRIGHWYLLRIMPYRTLENVIEGAVLTFVDITELKHLRESEQHYQRRLATVMADANDAIIVQDFEGRILAWNPAAERMYGWSEAEALAINIRNTIPEDRRAEAEARMRQLAPGEVVELLGTQRVARDGRVLDIALTATTLVDAAGNPYAMATTERDMTGRGSKG